MRAVVWQGKRDVRVETVPDPRIEEPTDAIVRITSTGLCGSDLHLYEVMAPFMTEGDILGHEPMGIVEAVGSEVTHIAPGDRVVIPFNISCGHCRMCADGLQSQCETTQVREYDKGAALFGYTKLYGQVPGGQAELLRVPQAQYGPIKVPEGPADDRFVYLSDVLPTAWQAVQYAGVADGGTLVVLGLGPIGSMACRVATHLGAKRVIGIDLVPERLERARMHGRVVVERCEIRRTWANAAAAAISVAATAASSLPVMPRPCARTLNGGSSRRVARRTGLIRRRCRGVHDGGQREDRIVGMAASGVLRRGASAWVSRPGVVAVEPLLSGAADRRIVACLVVR